MLRRHCRLIQEPSPIRVTASGENTSPSVHATFFMMRRTIGPISM